MPRILPHFRRYIFRGLLAVIPLALSIGAIWLLYALIDKRVTGLIGRAIGFHIPGLGILLVALTLYLLGMLTSNVIGRQLFAFIERVTHRIPLVNTVYQVGKQLSGTLSLPERQLFRRPVLLPYFAPDTWAVGFVTGTLVDRAHGGEKLLRVFVPSPPNPTGGFLLIVKESATRDPGWTIEEALKFVISGGLIGPEEIKALAP